MSTNLYNSDYLKKQTFDEYLTDKLLRATNKEQLKFLKWYSIKIFPTAIK